VRVEPEEALEEQGIAAEGRVEDADVQGALGDREQEVEREGRGKARFFAPITSGSANCPSTAGMAGTTTRKTITRPCAARARRYVASSSGARPPRARSSPSTTA
jgi:hypothetical protein